LNELILTLETTDQAQFWGTNNDHYELIKLAFPKLKIVARGNDVKVLGDEAELITFSDKFNQLLSHLDKFRTLSVSKNMVETILQWYLRHKNYIRTEDQRKGLSPLQIKRKTISNVADPKIKLRQLATNTAKNIKKRGIGRVGFFDDNLDKAFGQEFQAKLAQALGQDIALTITQTFKK
jgi:hypothetical protein